MKKSKFNLSRLVCELAEMTALEYSEIATPLDKILEEEEIPCIEDDYDDVFDGMTVYDGQFYIHLNTNRGNYKNSPRGRFTLAHELGHCLIEKHRLGLMKGLLKPHPSKSNQSFHIKIEREADYFASCLLMPSSKFQKQCEKQKFSFSLIEDIANKFQVSLTAAALRFTQVGNHSIMVVYSKGDDIVWFWPSQDFPFKWLLHGKNNIPINTQMSDYFTDGKKLNEKSIVYAQDWFVIRNKQDFDREFYERCIYGPDGVISVIWEE